MTTIPSTRRSVDREGRAGRAIDRERRDRLVEVAWLHHEFGLTQDAIARRYGVSRSTISRALSDAEALGIVQVTVSEPLPGQWRLSEALGAALGVTAHVGASLPGDAESGEVVAGRAAARLIERIVAGGHVTLATSWGRTLSAAARQLRARRAEDVTIVDAVGYASGSELGPALDVTRGLAERLAATAVHIASPAFADPASHAFLASSPPVTRALELARRADVILTSVGVVGPDSLLLQEGLLDAAAMARMVGGGAVGEILGHYFDAAGREVSWSPLLVVGLSMDDLRAAKRVIAVASGGRKAEALHAAISGRIVNEVVVDDALARALLASTGRSEPEVRSAATSSGRRRHHGDARVGTAGRPGAATRGDG